MVEQERTASQRIYPNREMDQSLWEARKKF